MPFKVPFGLICLAVLTVFLSVVSADQATYEYDELNRLIKVTYEDGAKITYYYDEAGNRTKRSTEKAGGCSTQCHGALGSLGENWQENFTARVKSGEITQETIETILKSISEVANESYHSKLRENMSSVSSLLEKFRADSSISLGSN
jgi:YD repeat-containing protein